MKQIKPGYIDFLKSEAEVVLADQIGHTELERELSKGLLDLIALIKDLDKVLQTVLPDDPVKIKDWEENIWPLEDEDK